MKKGDVMKTLSWLIPVVCFVLAGALVYWQYGKLQAAQKEDERLVQEINVLNDQITNYQAVGGKERIPSVEDSRLEESMFLDMVRRKALEHGVHLDKWTNEAPIMPPPPPKPTDKNPAQPAAMSTVKTLVSTVEVRGDFAKVRSFLQSLIATPRLLNVKSGTWTRASKAPETTFNFKLHRYVSTVPLAPPPTASALAPGGGAA